MSTPIPDIGQLTEDQQLALQQYTAVTDQATDAAIPLLQRCQWNVQIAIARFFDGEPAEPTLANGFSPRSSSSRSRRALEPAPRVVPQPEGQVTRQAPLILQLLSLPLSFAYGLFSRVLGLFTYLFPFLSRLFAARTASHVRQRDTSGRRPLNPRDTAARFIREFEEEYGDHGLPFVEGGYAQAFDQAKKDLKFLLVILVSPEHDDTSSFIKETLLSREVVEMIKSPANNIILWAGNVQDAEAYQVSSALNCTKFPFASVIVHTPSVSSTAMSVVARIVGPTPPTSFMSKVQTAIAQNSEPLNRTRAVRAEQQATRDLREAQNSAYERSLAQDRERARLRREAEEARERADREEREREEAAAKHAQNLEQWKRWRASRISPEPGADASDIVRISLRMPSGERIVRKFDATAEIEELYAFVECYDVLQEGGVSASEAKPPTGYNHEYKFQLVSPMPREAYELEKAGTIKERIGRSGNLIVERTDLESEDEDEDE
ncbi:UBX domain protein [Saccharata proteae CBS 121410]|uniref:UBX domain protein n=1 Tax=Saccharata proteae CBS 121410 TaxID=1314787 RepID=A0A9P4HWC6_9PEZI|nr:UBX domain protein [Saccharata proteae CBS 121410]